MLLRASGIASAALLVASLLPAATPAFDADEIDAGASGDDKAVADLDGDGWADGVLGGAQLRWWRSLGPSRQLAGPYLLRTADFEFTTDMDAADLDGDGDVDLVVADGNGGDNVEWLENPVRATPAGKGSDPTDGANWLLHPIGTHGTWAHDIAVGDVDGDGRPDVLTSGNGDFKIFFANGDGTWTASDFGGFADDGAVALADIDGDGDGDRDLFVRGGWIRSPPAGRRTPGAWSFHAITASDPGDGPALLALDVDRDGHLDLLSAPQHVAGSFAWFHRPADPTAATWPRTEIDAATGSHHLRSADVDGDGRLDVLTGLELAALTVWRLHGATPTFTPTPIAASGGHNAAAGDFDGDCLPDVWAADYIGHPPLTLHWNDTGGGGLLCDGFESGGTTHWVPAP